MHCHLHLISYVSVSGSCMDDYMYESHHESKFSYWLNLNKIAYSDGQKLGDTTYVVVKNL